MTVVVPYVTTMILIIFTGDRITGMKLGVMPGLILPQILFGLWFIKKPLLIKALLTLTTTAIIYMMTIWIVNAELIKTNFDIYGAWDLSLTNFISGLVCWEAFYLIDTSITKISSKHSNY